MTNILLVDDDEDDRMFFEEALGDLALEATLEYAENGREALKMLTDRRPTLPDVIFLDMNMPLMSGMECLERIRADEYLKDLKVIIYSTSSDPETRELFRGMGADRYMRKPGAYRELKRCITAALKSLDLQYGRPVPEDRFAIQTSSAL